MAIPTTHALFPMSAPDRDMAIRCLCGEADDQGAGGKALVAWVMRNRATWTPKAWWGSTIGQVVNKAGQFSCMTPGSENYDRIMKMLPTDAAYLQSANVLDAVLNGDIPDQTGGSTTYKVIGTKASWDHAVAAQEGREFGKHVFWRLDPTGPCLAFLTDGIGGTDGSAGPATA